MGERKAELTDMAVRNIKRRGINFVGGATGLGLNVSETGGRSWVLRYQVSGKRRDMGLGGYPDITLAQARESARAARAKLVQGIDPVEDIRLIRSRLIAKREAEITFGESAKQYVDAHEDGWRNVKHVQQWRNTIETYAAPVIGRMLVNEIQVAHILAILTPIWQGKTETASRLRGRIEQILDWAIARGYR